MDDKSLHLIERAAALLRSATNAVPSDTAPPADVIAQPAFEASNTDPVIAASLTSSPLAPTVPPAAPPPQAPPIQPPTEIDDVDDGAITVDMLKNAGLVLLSERTRTTEEFRISVGRILRNLRGLNGGAGANLVMVTSARPGEGKSFAAINLAASMAQNGMSDVILIDADGKPSSSTSLMGLRHRNGLFDLSDDPMIRIEDVLIPTEIPGLSLIPLGGRQNGADAGITRPVSAAIERVARRYPDRVVLIDTPPCLYTSDPSTLASQVDLVVLVVEAEKTQRTEIESSLELIHACPNIMLMLNKVKTRNDSSFGAYYYYSGYPT
jgi:receptor protein-tyrosine kinase